MNEGRDPGWRPAFRVTVPWFYGNLWRRRPPDVLTDLRMTTIGIVASFPLFLVALTYVVEGSGSLGPAALVVVAVGVLSHIGITVVERRKGLSIGSPSSLAISWQSRYFTALGLAEIPALVGLALTFPTDMLATYVLGALFSLSGIWRIAPSLRNLARDQEAIRADGSSLDLTSALMTKQYGSGSRDQGPV